MLESVWTSVDGFWIADGDGDSFQSAAVVFSCRSLRVFKESISRI